MRIFLFIFFLFFGIFSTANNIRQNINLIISVDWEGFSLDDHNIKAFQKFRTDYPGIKIVHFLNAAYFLNKNMDIQTVTAKINSVIRDGDELGLHIHALETLLDAAKVPYREDYTFWGRPNSSPINGVRGHDVPLTLFSEDEIRRLIRTSIDILRINGFKNLKSFRAGGWAASPEVLSALIKEGITIDSSAVPPSIVKNVTGDDLPLYYNIVNKLWKDTTVENTMAYEIKTSAGLIFEIPNNFGLADYITGVNVFKTFKKLIDHTEFNNQLAINVHYGFHQETAAQYIDEVRLAIDKITNYVQAYQIDLVSKTFKEVFEHSNKTLSCQILF